MNISRSFGKHKSPDTNHKPSWALFYARDLKIPVFPLYETEGERCACGKKNCTDQGKHHRIENSVYAATLGEGRIRRWWTR